MVFNLVVQDDPVGLVRGQPGQAERVGGGSHQVDGGHGRGRCAPKTKGQSRRLGSSADPDDAKPQQLKRREQTEREGRARSLRPFCLSLGSGGGGDWVGARSGRWVKSVITAWGASRWLMMLRGRPEVALTRDRFTEDPNLDGPLTSAADGGVPSRPVPRPSAFRPPPERAPAPFRSMLTIL